MRAFLFWPLDTEHSRVRSVCSSLLPLCCPWDPAFPWLLLDETSLQTARPQAGIQRVEPYFSALGSTVSELPWAMARDCLQQWQESAGKGSVEVALHGAFGPGHSVCCSTAGSRRQETGLSLPAETRAPCVRSDAAPTPLPGAHLVPTLVSPSLIFLLRGPSFMALLPL